MTKKDATGCLDDFVGLIVKHLQRGQQGPHHRASASSRCAPARRAWAATGAATGEAIKIKASKRVAFRVAKDFKDAI